ncbi:hypothetical protein [Thaumasiovibrio subtropicus]|uniref:hypothetical protein n=1 Tax=Thaumasiovibrio subtropicus TaxID=1891207 RepID=UPI000B35DD33|nr:hypothetical protein [Thaumasiovibrio subtropicus]
MVSIHGLPPTLRQSQKVQNKKTKKSEESASVARPSAVATAVSRGIRRSEEAETAMREQARIQYDAPDRKHQQALSSYHDVLNQRRRDELSEMFGVDIYV